MCISLVYSLGYAGSDKEKGGSSMQSANPVAVIETSLGVIKAELYSDKAPKTVANFVKLIESGFYNGIIFHRVIDGFMIQTGDPTGTGMGGSSETIPDEFSPDLGHDSMGILSMANAGPQTASSQFFITLNATSWLDGKHAVFGKVISGMDVVTKIGAVTTKAQDRPVTDIKMTKVYIEK